MLTFSIFILSLRLDVSEEIDSALMEASGMLAMDIWQDSFKLSEPESVSGLANMLSIIKGIILGSNTP